MNLIVHIGTAKTGTTTIQKMLFDNNDILRSKGFHFLQCACPKNNRALPAYCINDGRNDDFFRKRKILSLDEKSRFRDELRSNLHKELSSLGDGIHTVIISSEQFTRLKYDAEIRRFNDLVSPYFSDIRILCWLREQCEMATSLYSTAMISGATLDFNDHLKQCHTNNTRYNYYAMLNLWTAAFGVASIEVKVFSKHAFFKGNFICDYLMCISPDLIPIINNNIRPENISINALGQRLLLTVNRLSQRHAYSWLKNNSLLRRIIVRIVKSCFSGQGCTPSTVDYKRTYDLFYQSNKMLSNKYLGKNDKLFDFSPLYR